MPQGRDDEERLTADIIELPDDMAAMATARSQLCCVTQAGWSTTSGWSGFGGARA